MMSSLLASFNSRASIVAEGGTSSCKDLPCHLKTESGEECLTITCVQGRPSGASAPAPETSLSCQGLMWALRTPWPSSARGWKRVVLLVKPLGPASLPVTPQGRRRNGWRKWIWTLNVVFTLFHCKPLTNAFCPWYRFVILCCVRRSDGRDLNGCAQPWTPLET